MNIESISKFIDSGQCFGYAHTSSRVRCPTNTSVEWKYWNQGSWNEVEGLVISTVREERNVPTCDNPGEGANSVGFDTIRDRDFQRSVWAVAEERYGSGGRAFLNRNMPGYNILDGAIEGGLDADCEFVTEPDMTWDIV